MKWQIRESSYALDLPWMKVRKDVVELPSGNILDDYYMWVSGDVALMAPVAEDGSFVLVEQYKHAAGEVTLEFPGGFVSEDESAIEAAKRELLEETGYAVSGCERIATVCDNPTKVVGNLHLFLGVNCRRVAEPSPDPTESITVRLLSRSELLEAIRQGRIRVTGTIAAAFLALQALP